MSLRSKTELSTEKSNLLLLATTSYTACTSLAISPKSGSLQWRRIKSRLPGSSDFLVEMPQVTNKHASLFCSKDTVIRTCASQMNGLHPSLYPGHRHWCSMWWASMIWLSLPHSILCACNARGMFWGFMSLTSPAASIKLIPGPVQLLAQSLDPLVLHIYLHQMSC